MFDEKTERYLDLLDRRRGNFEEIIVELEDVGVIVDGINVLYFDEPDVLRFVTTNDDFYMHVTINNHKFTIHSDFYHLIDEYFSFNRYDEFYRLHLI